MIVTGSVISISLKKQVKKNGGGSYEGWELVYRNDEDEVKTIAKPVQSLRFNAGLKEGLEQLSPGDEFSLVMEKNNGGFWDVKSVSQGKQDHDAQYTSSPRNAPQQQGRKEQGGKVVGSNYPTAEERERTGIHIARQNSIGNAVNYFSAIGNKKATPDDILQVAKVFEQFIFTGKAPNPNGHGFENMQDDIPE